jgi:hypothetical protein
MSTFFERYDSNRRVGLYVVRTERKWHHRAFLRTALLIAPIFWALFAWKHPNRKPASKEKYP